MIDIRKVENAKVAPNKVVPVKNFYGIFNGLENMPTSVTGVAQFLKLYKVLTEEIILGSTLVRLGENIIFDYKKKTFIYSEAMNCISQFKNFLYLDKTANIQQWMDEQVEETCIYSVNLNGEQLYFTGPRSLITTFIGAKKFIRESEEDRKFLDQLKKDYPNWIIKTVKV
jgi:hypothetical protein